MDRREYYSKEAEIFKALAHPCRLYLLNLLRSHEIQVCEMARETGRRQPYISQHLAMLRSAGLVHARREGACVYYCLADARVGELVDLCAALAACLKGDEQPALVVPDDEDEWLPEAG
ncbi:MAG: ArsR/SmtB family transcription factor [Anaerolineae bacterium]